MAKCLKCGKTYLTKECIHCRDQNYRYNKEAIKSTQGKDNKNLWIIAFFILFISSALVFTMAFFKIQELKNISDSNYEELRRVETKNQELERKNNINKRLIESSTKQIRDLTHQLRDRSPYQANIRKFAPKRKKVYEPIQTKVRYASSTPTPTSTKKQTNRKSNAYKKYYNYTGYEKLVSDSEIQKRNDNRLKSNSPIDGLYKRPLSLKISCGNNPRIYKIRNECSSLEPYTNDRLYFSKININELKNFNERTHKIECKYSQEHGLMHDCRTKIFKYEYK